MSNTPVHFTVMINIGLAVIPFILALLLFKKFNKPEGIISKLIWWLLCACFIAFLPNSAYALTDIIHFFAAVKSPEVSLTYLMLVLVPFYFAYMLFCFECYVLSVQWSDNYFQQSALTRPIFTFVIKNYSIIIHFLTAIGVYLGRFQRLESADIVRNPWIVFQDIAKDLTQLKSLSIICALFGLFFIGSKLLLYINKKLLGFGFFSGQKKLL